MEIGRCDPGRARALTGRGGRYMCVVRPDLGPTDWAGPDEVMREDPDWWCGGAIGDFDAALIFAPERLRRLDHLLEVTWHQLRRGALLILAGACVARPVSPSATRFSRTAAQLHTSLVYAGFGVVSMADTTEGVVFGARRT